MKILILSGGTGSVQLQYGISNLFQGIPKSDITILVNAYDNGLSTGLVRKVFDGKILGPSDVRKNQTLIHRLTFGSTAILDFLNIRFSLPANNVKEYALSEICKLSESLTLRKIETLKEAIEIYFSSDNALLIDYDDFSLSNIIYASLAAKNKKNSLRAAATIMADILDIPDSVILNDDTSLFLKAVSESGSIIGDEGEIVTWNNPNDKIASIFFEDENGSIKTPVLCQEAKNAIEEADIIISSSGTQWSSLIPTYVSAGFKEQYENAKGKKFLVMNKSQDKDMLGVDVNSILRTISTFMSLEKTQIVIDINGDKLLSNADSSFETGLVGDLVYCDCANTSNVSANKHEPNKLARAIFGEYYSALVLNAEHLVFDYDDTVVGRGNSTTKADAINKEIMLELLNAGIDITIVTGNSIKALSMRCNPTKINVPLSQYKSKIKVYADGGLNLYEYDMNVKQIPEHGIVPWTFLECINPNLLFTKEEFDHIVKMIVDLGIPRSKIENRHNATISVKPIDKEYRRALKKAFELILVDYDVMLTGRTTIDITKAGANKAAAAAHLLKNARKVVFIGDEIGGGNDTPFVEYAQNNNSLIAAIPVKDPNDTARFLRVLYEHKIGEKW